MALNLANNIIPYSYQTNYEKYFTYTYAYNIYILSMWYTHKWYMYVYIYIHLYVYVFEYVHVYVNEFVYEYVYECEYV